MLNSHVRNLLGHSDVGTRTSESRATTACLRPTAEPSIWDGFIPEPVLPEEMNPRLDRGFEKL